MGQLMQEAAEYQESPQKVVKANQFTEKMQLLA